MAFKSVITVEKPMLHLDLADWNERVNQMRKIGEKRTLDAFNIRQSSRSLRNDTRIESNWLLYETDEQLTLRLTELRRWRETISLTYERIIKEMSALVDEKGSTERELETLTTPISVLSECLAMRDCRLGSELTYDDADSELKNELAMVENNQQILIDLCQKAWEKLNRLEDVKFKLGLELDNKHNAELLDQAQLNMNKFSSNISYKPDPTRNPKNCVTYESWLENTKSMKQMAENELADTYAIREALFVCREKARNMLIAQQERTEHTLRKRIFETQRARNELEWQQRKMKEEMEQAVCEIRNLEQSLRDKTDGLKLAETRLENRAQRSGMELSLDDAHDQLCSEVTKLRNIRRRLIDQIDDSKTNFNLLESYMHKITVDLSNKQHSMMTDIRAMDLRERLRGGEFGQASNTEQTERNILLVKLDQQLPKKI